MSIRAYFLSKGDCCGSLKTKFCEENWEMARTIQTMVDESSEFGSYFCFDVIATHKCEICGERMAGIRVCEYPDSLVYLCYKCFYYDNGNIKEKMLKHEEDTKSMTIKKLH